MPKRAAQQEGSSRKRLRKEHMKQAENPTHDASAGGEASTANTGGEHVRAEPPAWADYRTNLCDALGWFRSVQGGSYQSNKLCFGFLLDKDSGPRAYIDDEIVISRVGGGCALEPNGALIQQKDQDEASRSVRSLLESKKSGLAVGLVIGSKNQTIMRQLPHRYNVMAWFRVVDVWFEKIDGKTGARVRFQKLDLEQPSWWAIKGSKDPLPLSQRTFLKPQSQICGKCSSSSSLIYEQGWMCLQPKCPAFWQMNGGCVPKNLTYDTRFLSSREPLDDQIQPEFSLVPDLLTDLSENSDAWTQRVAWRGVVCPECHKCISRRYWNGWICHDPLDGKCVYPVTCQWKMIMDMPAISLRSVLTGLELGVTKRAIRTDNQFIQPVSHFSKPYQRFTYTIENVGNIVHFSANKSTLGKPNGPNDLFERLQKVDLGLRRYPLQQCAVEGTLTSHYAVNFGMPYKYVVSVDSKGFDQAPVEIMYALGRLSWATKQAVGEEAVAPNELLALGYFDKMSIGFHDDGESSLGPTIATLSLGSKATMKIRLKDQYFRGCRLRANAPLADDTVLPGCDKFSERRKLKEQHEHGKLTHSEYAKCRMELAKTVARREADSLITLDLHHGDMVVMHGALLQNYYEHSVSSEGKLRFALTSRYIKPEEVEQKEHAKGQFVLTPDQVYDGE